VTPSFILLQHLQSPLEPKYSDSLSFFVVGQLNLVKFTPIDGLSPVHPIFAIECCPQALLLDHQVCIFAPFEANFSCCLISRYTYKQKDTD
jgi:hypothetical protein